MSWKWKFFTCSSRKWCASHPWETHFLTREIVCEHEGVKSSNAAQLDPALCAFSRDKVLFEWIPGSTASLHAESPNLERNLRNDLGKTWSRRSDVLCLFLSWLRTLSRVPSLFSSKFPACAKGTYRGGDWVEGGRVGWIESTWRHAPLCWLPWGDCGEKRGEKNGNEDRKTRGRRGRHVGRSGRFSSFEVLQGSTLIQCVCALGFRVTGTCKVTSLCVLSPGRDYCRLLGRVASSQSYYGRCWTSYLCGVYASLTNPTHSEEIMWHYQSLWAVPWATAPCPLNHFLHVWMCIRHVTNDLSSLLLSFPYSLTLSIKSND